METIKTDVAKDFITPTGISLIVTSTLIFLLPEISWFDIDRSSYFGVFFFNYFIAILYGIILMIKGILRFKKPTDKKSVEHIMLLLILFFISAFSLNRELPIFEKSTIWVCVYITILCISSILSVFRYYLPRSFNYVLAFILGTGVVLYLYYSIFLMPYYMIGFIAFLFLGISLHVFAPFCLFIFTIRLFFKFYKENKFNLYPFIAGVLVPILFAAGFVFQWQSQKNKVNFIVNESVINESPYPLWAKVSQQMPKGFIMERMLKADLVYSTPNQSNFWGWNMPTKSFDEAKKHDPLVMISSLFSGKLQLEEDEKFKILESMYDSRHKTQERLWAGDMLETSNVISNIKLFPEYRIAYTEKIVSVTNNAENHFWNGRQEAIYTFHLPEGGVVTSLSLWINGKEEKGVLTTKAKADSAYKTVVGVEQRDPSLIHWQEGSTLSVRVFPCTPKENRRFKIGITAPLRKEENKLVYENIYFDGPTCENATESVQLQFTKSPQDLDLPFKFSQLLNNTYKANKNYEPYWEIKLNAPAVSTDHFVFNDCSYSVENYSKQYESFTPEIIYLDLNNSWSKDELLSLWEKIKTKEVYAFQDDLIKVDENNVHLLAEHLDEYNFSLFPFYKVKNPEHSLVISKSTSTSPNLKDLKDSNFSNKLIGYLKNKKQIKLYSLSHDLSPYLKTLKEFRVFSYDQGNMDNLDKLLKGGQFIRYQENDSSVIIDNAQIVLKEKNGEGKGMAPDHLLRLFAYNNIMRKIAENYFDDNFIREDIINDAKKAYVVTPVSSLIVLETQKDYERFGIKDADNSLKNASMKSSGAVPEPHEWVLIILTVLVVLYLFYKSYLERKTIF